MTRFQSRGYSFIVAVAMLVFVLPKSYANAETNTLSDAIMRTNMATAVESTGKLNLKFKAEGLSEQDGQDFEMVSEILNNLQLNFNTKVSGNDNGTISRQYVKMSANVGGSPYQGELWSDMNLDGKIPVVKGIVKAPQLFEMMLSPEYTNKYMLMDIEEMNKMPEMQAGIGSLDFGKMISENKQLQGAILTLIEKYSSQLSSGYNFISKEGNVYKVKIDDATFKDIIRKAVNLTAKNSEIQDLIRNLVITEMKNSGASTEEINSTKVDMQQMFTTLEAQGFLDGFNKIMDKLMDVKILGNKGIDITYTIDENGYVTSIKGDIEFVVDMAKLDSVFDRSAIESAIVPKGIYTVGINFEVNNSNINGNVNIVLPTLNSTNSFNIKSLFAELEQQQEPEVVAVKHTVTGGQLPKTSTYLYEILLMGAVLTLVGALTWKSKKHYE